MRPTSSCCHGRWHTTPARGLGHHTRRRSPLEVALDVRVSPPRQPPQPTIAPQLDRLHAPVAAPTDGPLAAAPIERDDGSRGAKRNRPGLDRRRDRAALAACALVVMTAPARLARNAVHHRRRLDALAQRGGQVEFLERPMSQDPQAQLGLQIRGPWRSRSAPGSPSGCGVAGRPNGAVATCGPGVCPPTAMSWTPSAPVIPGAGRSILSKPR